MFVNTSYMALITLTSDLGIKLLYLAALKGAIISNCGLVTMADITHGIKPFDIKDAAFTFRSAYHYFPKGTIHIVHINSTDGDNKLLVSLVNGHYIITFDSGFLPSLLIKHWPKLSVVNDELHTGGAHLLEDAVGKAVNLLIKEFKPSDFGHLATETLGYRLLQPITLPGSIRGTL